MEEGRLHEGVEPRGFGGRELVAAVAEQDDDGRRDFRARHEARRRDVARERHVVAALERDGDGAAVRRAFARRETQPDLLLEQQHHPFRRAAARGGVDHDAGADGVGEVGDEMRRAGFEQRGEIRFQRVAADERKAGLSGEALFEERLERGILFDGRHARAGAQEARRERAEAGADLDDARAGDDPCLVDDAVENVAVREEVLPERLARADAAVAEQRGDVARGFVPEIRRKHRVSAGRAGGGKTRAGAPPRRRRRRCGRRRPTTRSG